MSAKVNNIQGLRAFAAISVASFHTRFMFSNMRRSVGSFGVDIFFVISGYIMARICTSDSQFFLRRRVLRIVPPYWAGTVLLFFLASWHPDWMKATRPVIGELAKSLLFIPYVKPNGVTEPLLFVGWSLNYEMYFYTVLAFSLLLFRRQALWLASAILLAVTAICVRFGAGTVAGRFYGRDMTLEFVLGIIVFFLCGAVPQRAAQRLRLPALFLLFSSGAILILIQSGMLKLPLPRSIDFGGPAFLLVGSACVLSQGGGDVKLRWLVLIGDASYILYLLHSYCEYFIDRVIARRIHWLSITALPGYVAAMTVAVLLSVLIHVKVERPTVAYLNRKWGGKRISAEFVSNGDASGAEHEAAEVPA